MLCQLAARAAHSLKSADASKSDHEAGLAAGDLP